MVFSMGCVLYEMATHGLQPFTSYDATDTEDFDTKVSWNKAGINPVKWDLSVSVCVSVSLSFSLCLCLSVSLSLSLFLSLCLLPLCLSVCLTVCLSVCLSVSLTHSLSLSVETNLLILKNISIS